MTFCDDELRQSHFKKHGREFGLQDELAYERAASALAEAPPSASVLECVTAGRRLQKFNRLTGEFVSVAPDRCLLTYFRPSRGYDYFRSQCPNAPLPVPGLRVP